VREPVAQPGEQGQNDRLFGGVGAAGEQDQKRRRGEEEKRRTTCRLLLFS